MSSVDPTAPQPPVMVRQRMLQKFSVDLTELAERGALDPVVGREREIARVMRTLTRRVKNNPLLVGEAGVGKTAIVEALATAIARGEVPRRLKGRRVLSLDLAAIVAGSKYRGEFEDRVRTLLDEVRKSERQIVLFIDELHLAVGVGAFEGALNVSNLMKPALARGELQCIGATTTEEYRRYIEKDAALARRFRTILVEEPDVEQCVRMLAALRRRYEQHHHVVIGDEVLGAAARLAVRYVPDRRLPDKAIDLIDEAASGLRQRLDDAPDPAEARLEEDERLAAAEGNYELAAQLRDARLTRADRDPPELTAADIAATIADWTGIAVDSIREESRALLDLERTLGLEIVGQSEAIAAVARAVRRHRAGFHAGRDAPLSFLFVGPPGVGKSALARALAAQLLDHPAAFLRYDMSDFGEKHAVSRLVGAPPGYVGHDQGGQLTEAVRLRPHSVILLYGVEAAHPETRLVLKQLLETGRLTDGQSRTVDFRSCIVILTSSTEWRTGGAAIGYRSAAPPSWKPSAAIGLDVVRAVDEVIELRPLDDRALGEIVELHLRPMQATLERRGIALDVDPGLVAALVAKSRDDGGGARSLLAAIRTQIETRISEFVLEMNARAGDRIRVRSDGDNVVLEHDSGGP